MTSHQFNPSPYFNQFDEDRIKLHNEVEKLNKRGWGYTKINITTHAIEGLSENDFILAAKIDQIINV